MDLTPHWVVRGGSFLNGERYVRAASRGDGEPDERDITVGFRVVVPPPTHRVVRGGSFGSDGVNSRAARRDRGEPYLRSGYLGFRLVVSS